MEDYVKAVAYIATAIVVAFGTMGPAIAQGMIGSKGCENVGKYPESYGNIFNTMILGMVFPETIALFATLVGVFILLFSR